MAGFDVVGAVDAEDVAVETYEANLCEGDELNEYDGSVTFDAPLQADLSRGRSDEYADLPSVDYEDVCEHFDLGPHEVDLVCGCPPCQNYSTLRDTEPWDEDEPKDLLLKTYVQFVEEAKPDFVFFENVPGILNAGEDEPTDYIDWFLRRMRSITRDGDDVDEGGYGVDFQVKNAANYGVPQRRRRTIGLFVYGADDEDIKLPDPSHAKNPRPNSDREEWVTVKEILLDQDYLKVDLNLGQEQVGIDGYEDDSAHRARRHRQRTVKRIEAIRRHGDSWRDLLGTDDEEYVEDCHLSMDADSDGANAAYGIMAADKPSQTLTTKCTNVSSGRFTHPTQNRAISLREAATLMTFPRWFEFPSTWDDSETVVGNAVPSEFVKALIEGVRVMNESLISDSLSQLDNPESVT
jgi:DNA (cytosine-5)-methyltransferase 1